LGVLSWAVPIGPQSWAWVAPDPGHLYPLLGPLGFTGVLWVFKLEKKKGKKKGGGGGFIPPYFVIATSCSALYSLTTLNM
jgi:hypothetical protein